MKRIIVAGVLILCASAAFPQSDNRPNDVVNMFFEKASQLDLDGMMGLFAIDEYAEHYDFSAMSTYLGSIYLQSQPLPGKYPFYSRLNRYLRQSNVVSQLKTFVVLVVSKRQDIFLLMKVNGPDQVAAMITQLDPSSLRGIQLRYLRYPVPKQNDDRMKALYQSQARREGATDVTERVALLETEGKTFVIPFRLLKYGDVWRIDKFVCTYAGLLGIEPMAEGDFLSTFPE